MAQNSGPTKPPQSAIVEIVAPLDIEQLALAFKKFEEFKERLLGSEDFVMIPQKQGPPKRYLKKSAWRKWALACGLSDEILEQHRTPNIGRDAKNGFYWRIATRVFHVPSGRSSVGVAIAASNEKDKWTHEEHDIYALAATRSKNRAIADLVGGGEVSAEEMEPAGWVDRTQEGKNWPQQPSPNK